MYLVYRYMYCLYNHFYVSNPNALAILYNVMVMPIKLLLNFELNLREIERERGLLLARALHTLVVHRMGAFPQLQ